MNNTISVFVATGCRIPFAIPEYCVPIEMGSDFRTQHLEGYIQDNTGDNISSRNHEYCELTALYWGWKNSDAQIKGLCHYRRFFHASNKVHIFPNYYIHGKDLLKSSPNREQVKSILQKADIILPIPYNPYPKTVRKNLEAYVYPKDIRNMEDILQLQYPAYFKTYCDIMERQRLPYCNMMIAPAKIYDRYCDWLFTLLDQIASRTDLTGYNRMHRRIYGYLAEVLLSVWVETQNLRAEYLNIAQIWDLWAEDKKKQDLVKIGSAVHWLEDTPAVSQIYFKYSAKRYPDVYHSYCELKDMVNKRRYQTPQ